jgi:hypothetical protein
MVTAVNMAYLVGCIATTFLREIWRGVEARGARLALVRALWRNYGYDPLRGFPRRDRHVLENSASNAGS